MLGGKVIICVGNFFEYYFGTKSRAPVVFRKAGFEWAFRMASEPGRLWSRYLIGIPKFIYRAFRIKLSSKKEFA
jgi:exopolysaccharide biosynthesis WecB/TagA/CpsF family protein